MARRTDMGMVYAETERALRAYYGEDRADFLMNELTAASLRRSREVVRTAYHNAMRFDALESLRYAELYVDEGYDGPESIPELAYEGVRNGENTWTEPFSMEYLDAIAVACNFKEGTIDRVAARVLEASDVDQFRRQVEMRGTIRDVPGLWAEMTWRIGYRLIFRDTFKYIDAEWRRRQRRAR